MLDRAGILFLILLVIAGLVYSAWLSPVPRFTDEQEYLKLSANLVNGPGFSMDGEHLTALRAPGYAFFLAALRCMDGGLLAFRIAQFILLGATILLVARLCSGEKILGGFLIVVGLVCCYPVLVYTGATLYPQTLAGFLFILALSLVVSARKSVGVFLVAGVCFGALILVAPTFLFTMAIVLGVALVQRMIRWPDAAWMLLAALLVVGSWTARNAISLHHFVPVASNSGLNFLEGNNPGATAEAAANMGMQPFYEQAGKLGLDEFQCDRFYREAAWTWITQHPLDALVLYFEKVANFFNIRNVYSSESQSKIASWEEIILAAGYLLLLGLLAWRLFDVRRFPLVPREKLFLIVYVLSAFTSAIFFTRIRHRLPYDYLIIAVVALNLSQRLEVWLGNGSPRNPS